MTINDRRRAAGLEPAPKLKDTMTVFCECYEEMCFCAETFEMPSIFVVGGGSASWRCTPCMQGRHVWSPGGQREPELPSKDTARFPTGMVRLLPPPDPHGYGVCLFTAFVLLVVFLALGLGVVWIAAELLWPH
jgi:hypothetical protein